MLNLRRSLVETVFTSAISSALAACVTPHLLSYKSGVLKVAENSAVILKLAIAVSSVARMLRVVCLAAR